LGSGNEAESLTSWLLRLANGNGFRTYGELFAYERRKLSRTAALDIDPRRWNLLHVMHELSLLPESVIARHTLDAELAALTTGTGTGTGTGSIRWTLTSHSVVQQNRTSRHAYCAQCLREDSIPYWRLGWRLSTTTICTKHGALLIDTCPECGTALCISPSRESALDRCHVCLFNLRVAKSHAPADNACAWRVTAPSELTPEDLPVSLSWSHLWWNGVRVLLSVFTQKVVRAKLSSLALPAPLAATLAGLPQNRRLGFDGLRVRTRHDLLYLVQVVTTNWPTPFVAYMSEAGVTAADFLTCEIEMPYWLDKVVNCDLNRKRYRVTEAEVRSAQALLRSRSTAVSKISVKRLLGVTEGVALDRLQPKRSRQLSDVELLRIAEQLDRDVRTAPSGRDVQASALRDAACIAAAAWLRIAFREATSLELAAGHALLKSWRESANTHGPRDRLASIFADWMFLYLEGTRPRFERFDRQYQALFLSRFGIPTNGFGLAARFAELLRRCDIEEWQFGCRLLSNPSKDASHRARGSF
jgi:hypothetical protein